MLDKDIEKELVRIFEELYSTFPELTPIITGGSSRRYYRLKSDKVSVIGVWGEDRKENEAFLGLAQCLKDAGINVPGVICIDGSGEFYLLEDLGDTSLFSLLQNPNRIELSMKALKHLLEIQSLPEELWKDKVAFKPFARRLVDWDLNYFKYDFLKPAEIVFDEEALEDDFENLAKRLLDPEMVTGFMYRDFQSRNIMVKDDKLWFIDFQGARKGPMVYDAVSFIWQAKAPFTLEERESLSEFYISLLADKGYEISRIRKQMEVMMIFRALQVLGAYGFRGLIEKKKHFKESIPYGVSNLRYLLEHGRLKPYPELERICGLLAEKYKMEKEEAENHSDIKPGLTLTVMSFSYKKGYPEDNSGNGGGFMFDCRALHNPGRYEEYKQLTGKDKEVREFLETKSEAPEFVEKALRMVEPSVEKYIERGFTSLQTGFGCTGGQHRSVYCAEKFAEKMREKYPEIIVKLIHREQSK